MNVKNFCLKIDVNIVYNFFLIFIEKMFIYL